MSNSANAVPEKVKGHCPKCGPDRWSDVKGHCTYEWSEGNGYINGYTEHYILICRGCETVFHQTDASNSEEYYNVDLPDGDFDTVHIHTIEHWPAPQRQDRPAWLGLVLDADQDLYSLLSDVYTALDNELIVLSAIGIRTAFDRGAELLGINPAMAFSEKLETLKDQGFIGESERDALEAMTEAGNASAHRGWKPSRKLLNTMVQIIESFVHRNFVLKDEAIMLKNAVPRRPSRRPASEAASSTSAPAVPEPTQT